MNYRVFKEKVDALIRRAGGRIKVVYRKTSDGRFFAHCSDGTEIIGNSGQLKVTVRWGGAARAHQAIAEI